MNQDRRSLLDHVSEHLENACKAVMLEDEPLVWRAEMASVELELLDPSSISSLPDGLISDVDHLVKLVASDLTQDGAVEFASRLLSLYVRVEVEIARL
jgi:hypothetical protein